jgi:hypothetical protein
MEITHIMDITTIPLDYFNIFFQINNINIKKIDIYKLH